MIEMFPRAMVGTECYQEPIKKLSMGSCVMQVDSNNASLMVYCMNCVDASVTLVFSF